MWIGATQLVDENNATKQQSSVIIGALVEKKMPCEYQVTRVPRYNVIDEWQHTSHGDAHTLKTSICHPPAADEVSSPPQQN